MFMPFFLYMKNAFGKISHIYSKKGDENINEKNIL